MEFITFHDFHNLTIFYFSLFLTYLLDWSITKLLQFQTYTIINYVTPVKQNIAQKANQMCTGHAIDSDNTQTQNLTSRITNDQRNLTDEEKLPLTEYVYRICDFCYNAACKHTSTLENIPDISTFDDLPCNPCEQKACIHYAEGFEPFMSMHLMIKLPGGHPVKYTDQYLRHYYQILDYRPEPLDMTLTGPN